MKTISMDESVLYTGFLLLLLLPALIILICKSFIFIKTPSLPPGPRPWPIIGNLHQIGRDAHISFTHFSKTYGPLVSLKLGSQLLIVASSPSSATQILKTHDRILSGRYIFKMSLPKYRPLSLVFSAQCDDSWKSLRSICRSNLFAAKMVESQAGLRRKKMREMVEFLGSKQGEEVKIKEIVFITVFNTLSNLIFSEDFLGFEGETFSGFKESMQKMMNLGLVPNLADFYPVLEGFDLQGLKKKTGLLTEKITFPFIKLMNERRNRKKDDDSERDFLDVLIESRLSDEQIKILILELLSAGTDTTTTTVEWAMAELIANKEKMHKVRAEIEEEMKKDAIVDESKLSKLHYLQACVKETLRLHPPAPFLLPREASEECEVLGYRIPEKARIFINVWAIGRDPEIWEEASEFKPERFMSPESEPELKGQTYEFLPFGGGRRLCPGMGMASVQVPLFLATLIRSFDWQVPAGEDASQAIFLKGKLGITMHKENPLVLIPRLKKP